MAMMVRLYFVMVPVDWNVSGQSTAEDSLAGWYGAIGVGKCDGRRGKAVEDSKTRRNRMRGVKRIEVDVRTHMTAEV